MGKSSIRIGGASGFWGDSAVGAPQLVRHGQIDYLVFDYLAELTMSILAAARMKDPELGYATDFVSVAMRSVLPEVVAKGIKVVSNAGGMNPLACAKALRTLAESQGLALKVAVVLGDDVLPLQAQLKDLGVTELQSGAALPAKLVSANAYLGAEPICQALNEGADVVITGRCVDSAVTLGILMHEFGWRVQPEDADKLAQGSLAGHLIECGAQATGGLFTDWQQVPDWHNIGYPVVQCEASGRFEVCKPEGTGGLVSVGTVSEQLVYEIGDPARYLLPDVVCDFTEVQVRQVAPNRVEVTGAKGLPPTPSYKVCATYMQGYRCSGQLTIVGMDAVAKAQRTGEAILARTRGMLAALGWGDYSDSHLEVLGAESAWGPHAQTGALATREAVLRLTVTHPNKQALELFAREIAPAGTSFAPGTTGAGGGRPSASPSIRQFAFLLPKNLLSPTVNHADGTRNDVVCNSGGNEAAIMPALATTGSRESSAASAPSATRASRSMPSNPAPATDAQRVEVALVELAWGRSGDKGDTSNIGLIARRPEWWPVLREVVTAQAVAQWLAFAVKGPVTRYELPGLLALNFVCEQALGGGGMASLRNDALGKGMGQIVLSMPIAVPVGVAQEIKAARNAS